MIDTETYQLISLGLGALLLLVLLLVLSALGKINKTLASGGSPSAAPAETDRAQPMEQPAAEPVSHPQASSEPVLASEPAAQPVQAAPVQEAYSPPVQEAYSPPVQETVPEQAAPAAQPASAEAIPEEQPFERDGRWWFKRGLEILVYDEQTGQWQPAPADNPFSGGVVAQPGAVTSQVPVAQESGAGFWKCPSCGAVNGATSATCRMCFAARP